MINERQAFILSAIIEEYIETAQPIASKTLVEKFDLGVSPATVRNDMVHLENVGFLRQPHTSSGRVPTEEGYRLYLEHCIRPGRPGKVCEPLRRAARGDDDQKRLMREIANTLVELSGETAISSINNEWNYYTGLSNLFDKPEFSNVAMLRSLSIAIDRFDLVLREIFEDVDQDVNVWIGGENPFGNQMATIMLKYRLPNGFSGLLGLVGPLRMDYSRNIKLLNQAKTLLDEEV